MLSIFGCVLLVSFSYLVIKAEVTASAISYLKSQGFLVVKCDTDKYLVDDRYALEVLDRKGLINLSKALYRLNNL